MPKIKYRNRNGTILPGVTTIIGSNLGWPMRALMHWAWKQGMNGKDYRDVADDAAQVGNIAHALVEADLRGKGINTSVFPEHLLTLAETSFEAWLEWKSMVDFKLIAAETSMVSERFQVGGTFDIAMVINGRSIMDIKTTNEIRESHIIQNCAYGAIWNELHPDEPIEKYYLLKLGKSGPSFGHHWWGVDHPVVKEAMETFSYLRKLHCKKNKIKLS